MSDKKIHLSGRLIIIFVLTLVSISISQKSIRRCDRNHCKNPSALVYPGDQKMNIEMTRTSFSMRAAPKKIDVIYVKRNWLTIYCYDGSSIDGNTGCYETIVPVLPTCREIREWQKYGFCKTGEECVPDGRCWGSSSDVCINTNPVMKSNVGPTSLKWMGERWMMFPHHTCISSWECLRIKAEVDIFAEIVRGEEIFYYTDKDNNKHIYNSQLYVDGNEEKSKGSIQCLNKPVISPKSETVEATCFGESKEKVKCVLNSEDEWDGVVIDVQGGEVAILRNALFRLIGPLYVPSSDGKIVNIGRTRRSNDYRDGFSKVYELTRSANIEDVLELSYSLTATQMQTIFNLLKLSEKVLDVERKTITMLRSLSVLDPMVMHTITGGDPYSIHWQTPNIFETCPCFNLGPFKNSNCNGEYMYKDGAYVEKNDTSMCKYYNQEEIKNVTLFGDINLEMASINILPPQTSGTDSMTWDTLADWRNDKIEGDHSSHTYRNLEDRLNSIYDSLGITEVTKWFWIATATIAWLSGISILGPILLNCRK